MKNVLLLICFVCCLWSCSSNEDGEGEGSIYGVVTLSGSTEPMRAMGVELYHEYSLLLKTVTYDDGHYEFDNIQPGNYQLLIVAEGYKKVSFNVVVEAGRTARADMQMVKIETNMTVRTLDIANDVEENQISFRGECTITNRLYKPREVGFVYAMTSNPSNGGVRVTGDIVQVGDKFTFQVSVKNLEKGTYYVQAYAKNSIGTEFGEVRTFQFTEYWILESSNLMVQKKDLIVGGAAWFEASYLCEASTLGGYTDWRLPTLAELSEMYNNQSIVGKLTGRYWSCVSNTADYRFYFDMSTGKSDYKDWRNAFNVRAVRTIQN